MTLDEWKKKHGGTSESDTASQTDTQPVAPQASPLDAWKKKYSIGSAYRPDIQPVRPANSGAVDMQKFRAADAKATAAQPVETAPTRVLGAATVNLPKSQVEEARDGAKYIGRQAIQKTVDAVKNIVNAPSYLEQSNKAFTKDLLAKQSKLTTNPDFAAKLREQSESMKLKDNPNVVNWGEKYAAETAKYTPTPAEKIIGDVVGAATGMIPTILSNIVAPGSGLYVMGVSAGSRAAEEAVKEGADIQSAVKYGTTVGIIEASTEKMFNGLGKIGELAGLKGVGDDTAKALISKLAKNENVQKALTTFAGVLGEGFEEYVAEFGDSFANKLLVQTDARSLKETNKDALYSFAVGGLLSALMQTSGAFAKGAKVTASELADKAVQATVQKIATPAQLPAAEQQTVQPIQMPQAAETNTEAQDEPQAADEETYSAEINRRQSEISALELEAEKQRASYLNYVAEFKQVPQESRRPEFLMEAKAQQDKTNAAEAAVEKAKSEYEAFVSDYNTKQAAKTAELNLQTAEQRAADKKQADIDEVIDIVTDYANRPINTNALIMAEKVGALPEEISAVREAYNKAERLQERMNLLRSNLSQSESLDDQIGIQDRLDKVTAQLDAATKELLDAQNKVVNYQKPTMQQTAQAPQQDSAYADITLPNEPVTPTVPKAEPIPQRTQTNEPIPQTAPQQPQQTAPQTTQSAVLNLSPDLAQAVDRLSSTLGVTVKVAPQIAVGGVQSAGNGMYDASTNTIYIASDTTDPIQQVLAHEFTHRIQDLAPAEYKRYRDYAVNRAAYDRGVTVRQLLDDKIARYGRAGVTLTDDLAKDEIAADFTRNIFTSEESLIKFAQDKPTLFERIGQILRDLLNRLKGVTTADDELKIWQRAYDKAAENYAEGLELSDAETRYSIRETDPPKNTKTGYKVFVAKDGKLYPPVVNNKTETPTGVWLDAETGEIATDREGNQITTKYGRPKVKSRLGALAFRPGWHLGELPIALQFYEIDKATGEKVMHPDYVWAECEFAADKNYQSEADAMSTTPNQKSLDYMPEDGYYKFRTNPDPKTEAWYITGAMKVNRILDDAEVREILIANGKEPMRRAGGDIDLAKYGFDVKPIKAAEAVKGQTEGQGRRYSVKDNEYNHTVILKEETIDKYLKDYAAPSSPNYAQAYIAYISPRDYLKLTTSTTGRARIEAESRSLNESEFADASLYQPIQLTINHETGEVEGHEGRHRAVALNNAGILKMPVFLFDYSNKNSKEPISALRLVGQDFGHSRSMDTTTINDVMPFNYINRDALVKKYATQPINERLEEKYNDRKTVRYSLKDSEGNTLTPEQAEFFKDSKVRDEDGNLLVVYHSTDNKFNTFDITKARSYTGNPDYDLPGFYFIADKGQSSDYGGRVINAFLNIKNPYTQSINQYKQTSQLKTWRNVYDSLIENGYDGIIDYDTGTDIIDNAEIVAFSPEQIKSVDNKNPTSDPDIRFSLKSDYENALETYKPIPQGEKAARAVEVPQRMTKDTKVRRFVRTAMETDFIGDEFQEPLKDEIAKGTFSYSPVSDAPTMEKAQEKVSSDFAAARAEWDAVVNGNKAADKNEIVLGEALLQQAAAAKNVKEVERLIAEIAAEGTRAGQIVQSMRLLKRLGPAGQLYYLERTVDNLNKQAEENSGAEAKKLRKRARKLEGEITDLEKQLAEAKKMYEDAKAKRDELKKATKKQLGDAKKLEKAIEELDKAKAELEEKNKNLDTKKEQLKGLKRAITGLGGKIKIPENLKTDLLNATEAYDIDNAIEAIKASVASQTPVTIVDKLNAWRMMAMLTNPRTHVRNILGNAVFVPAVTLKNVIGAQLERISGSAKTKAVKVSQERKDFAKVDANKMRAVLQSGGKLNVNDDIMRLRKIFNTQVLEKIRQFGFDKLESEDWWFLRYHYSNALGQYMQANKLNTDVSGQELENARAYALKEAVKATYRDASKAATALGNLSRMNAATSIFVEGLLPFKKTPINILKRGMEYSPLGIINGLRKLSDIRNTDYKTDIAQRQAVSEALDSFAASASGTGIFMLGMLLRSLGLLVGGFDDDKESQFADLQGAQPYALNFGDVSYTIDWMAPIAIPLFIGAELMNELKTEKDGLTFADIEQSVLGVAEPMFNLSMLDGLENTISSVKNVDEGELTVLLKSMALNYLSQYIPTAAGQLARTIDPTRRVNYTDKNVPVDADFQYYFQKLKNKIPGLSYTSEPYVDAWGRTDKAESIGQIALNTFENLLSPGYIDKYKTSGTEEELKRLYDATEESIFPKKPFKYFMIDGERKDLTAEEYTKYAQTVGETSFELLDKLTSNTVYKRMTDEQKVNAVKDVYELASFKGKKAVSNYTTSTRWLNQYVNNSLQNASAFIAQKAIRASYDDNTAAVKGLIKAGVSDKVILESMTQAAQDSYNEFASGVKASIFADVYSYAGSIKGDKDESGKAISGSKRAKVVEYIDKLKLTPEQKDTLYLAVGYAESEIWDVPW